MADHGHYCVPLLSGGAVLGVLTLYLEAGHARSEGEVAFLETVADTLSTLILKKRAEQARSSSEERLQAILDYTPAVVYLKDTEGRYLMVNRRYQELFHVVGVEMEGRTDYDLFPREVADVFRVHDAEVIDGGEPVEREERVPQDDGPHTYLSVKFPILDGGGRIRGVCGISTDITDRKRAEAEVCSARDQLEVRVRERTAELQQAHAQMLQQEKLASIGQLAAGVAHEINNPLGFIRSNFGTLQTCFADLEAYAGDLAEGLAAAPDGAAAAARAREAHGVELVLEDIRDIFAESRDGFDRIIAIIQSLKSFSRVDRSQAMGPYDVNEAIQSTLTVARNEIKYVAEVETELGEVPPVTANGQEINQVLLNLFVNAAQAIREHGDGAMGHIRVRTRHLDGHVQVQVEDDGGGMPPEVQKRVFEPFYTTKEVGKGTGLGLSIAHDIVVSTHHGSLSVDSEVGSGSTFTLELPVDQPANPVAGAA
jgi:PAS domain S-box-containing protein